MWLLRIEKSSRPAISHGMVDYRIEGRDVYCVRDAMTGSGRSHVWMGALIQKYGVSFPTGVGALYSSPISFSRHGICSRLARACELLHFSLQVAEYE